MSTADWFALAAVVTAVLCGVRYIFKRKNRSGKCKGCPYAASCGRECEKDGDKT